MRSAAVPTVLRYAPFRGHDAVAAGLLTRRQLEGPTWRRLYRDVYVSDEAELDDHLWCRAAALLLPAGGALSHRSAAFLFGANVLAMNAPVTVTLPPGAALRSAPRLHVCRAPLSKPADISRRGGLTMTSAMRTAFDLARGPDLVEAVVGVDALLYRRLISLDGLASYLPGHEGWPGVRRARRALRLAVPGVESPMETRLRVLLVLGGLPQPLVQFSVLDRAGHFVARLDLAYPRYRIGLEYDGDHHRERAVFQRDVVRLNALRLCGWAVLRFTADDVLRHPYRVVAQVRAALADHDRVAM